MPAATAVMSVSSIPCSPKTNRKNKYIVAPHKPPNSRTPQTKTKHTGLPIVQARNLLKPPISVLTSTFLLDQFLQRPSLYGGTGAEATSVPAGSRRLRSNSM